MTLAKAMKVRSRLVGRLNAVRKDIQAHNRTIVGNPIEVDVSALMDKEVVLVEKITELRTAITVANVPIWQDLIKMGELKERIVFFRGIPTNSGRSSSRSSVLLRESSDTEWFVDLTKTDVDDAIIDMENEIAELQDSIDAFNAATEIQVDLPEDIFC